ncbi:MAG: hypothetical protein AAFV36_04595 [Myxococcota bacterium]
MLAAWCVALPARAQSVSVDFIPGSDVSVAADELSTTTDAVEDLIRDEIRDVWNLNDLQGYLESFANAQAFSTRGLMADYASDFDLLIFGFGGNLSVAASDEITADDVDRPVDGIAPNLSAMVGLDFERFGLDGFRLFVAGFAADSSFDEFDIALRNWGVHGQIKLFGGDGDSTSEYFWDWGGLDITAGIVRATSTLTLEEELDTDLELDSDAGQLSVDLASNGRFVLEVEAYSIPIELTTNVTLLSIATLYGGLGTDIQLGDASIDLDLQGQVTADDPDGSGELDVGTVGIRARDSADASPGRIRGLLGVQLNLWVLKAYAQLNTLPGTATSVALGAKLAF